MEAVDLIGLLVPVTYLVMLGDRDRPGRRDRFRRGAAGAGSASPSWS